MAGVVPAISSASIQAIKDPNVQQVVRALADGVAVRNGDIGNGDNAFLTLAGLKSNKGKALELAKAIAGPLATGLTAHDELSAMADALRDRILKSPYWLDMFTRLKRITAPDTVPGSAAYLLLQEARSRRAAITRVESVVQTTTESMATSVETLTAAIGDTAAAILEEKTARATENESFATKLELMISSTGEAFAGIQDDLEVRTNNDNALAKAINTIWARVGTNEALVQEGTEIVVNSTGSTASKFEQLQATAKKIGEGLGDAVETMAAIRQDLTVTNSAVTGMAAKWSIKIDLDGYVSGVSLNAGKTPEGVKESMFIVLADVFAIGAPGKANIVPFAIDAKTGLVAIDGSLVATGTIAGTHLSAKSVGTGHIALKAVGGAQIDDLAVDTLQIKGNAVTIPKVVSRTDEARTTRYDFSWRDIMSTTIELSQAGHVLALVTCSQASRDGDHEWNMSLRINDIEVAFAGGINVLDAVALSGAKYLEKGTHKIALMRRSNDAVWATNRNMTVFGVMK